MASWNVVDGRNYDIKQKSNSLVINGNKTKLKDLMSKKDGIYRVYQVPIGSKTAQFYVNSWVGGTKLAMDGVDCATGESFMGISIYGNSLFKFCKWSFRSFVSYSRDYGYHFDFL